MIWLLSLALGAEVVVGTVGSTIQDAINAASPGDTVVVPSGDWPGPARVNKAITLTARDGGVIVGGTGQTVIVEAPGAVVSGVIVRGSGDDLRGPDACVFIAGTATGAVVRDGVYTDCLFGIWVNSVQEARVLNNDVQGLKGEKPASKGNGIHLFDSERLEVRGNKVQFARDGIYVSATHHSVIADNEVSHQRYGIHYMYAYNNEISGNIADYNTGGIALMQSRELVVRGNIAEHNEKHGILFRDAIDSQITGNTVAFNGEGMFFFSSVRNEIANNVIRGNQIGARVWAGTVDNKIHDNAFVANREQVYYVSASDQTWGSNYWSDYLGWDQDADGKGDRQYRNGAFTARMLHRFPQAVMLLSSPTLELLAHLQSRMPGLRVPSVIDVAPLMLPPVTK